MSNKSYFEPIAVNYIFISLLFLFIYLFIIVFLKTFCSFFFPLLVFMCITLKSLLNDLELVDIILKQIFDKNGWHLEPWPLQWKYVEWCFSFYSMSYNSTIIDKLCHKSFFLSSAPQNIGWNVYVDALFSKKEKHYSIF